MMYIRYFVGPMSKNVVDAVMEFMATTGNNIGFIPSRRQIEHDGGYANNWTTMQLRKHVGEETFIVRDHAGPGQGRTGDNGYDSLEQDCKYLNMIHIDPWKKYSKYEDGLRTTVDMINFCYNKNSEIEYEVGTEEAIRRFTFSEIDQFLCDLKHILLPPVYTQIKYCVIQSGTSLKANENNGTYDEQRLCSMIKVVKKHALLSKEHNGDYLPPRLIQEKFLLGLDSINIAPEFGQIETKTYVETIKRTSPDLLNTLWQICYDSKRWEKWVDNKFEPTVQREALINICGHYVLSSPEFLKLIKSKFPGIDTKIKKNIKSKLKELFNG